MRVNIEKMKIKIRESNIYYTVDGKGPVLVLLHGFLESSTIWNTIASQLSSHYRIVTIDLPGHGRSETIEGIHSMKLMAEVVHEVLNHLKINKVTIVGHSMGGYVALAFAENQPTMLSRLILLNSTPESDTIQRKRDRDRGLELLKSVPKAYIRMAIGNLFPKGSHEKFAAKIEALKQEASNYPMDGISAMILGMRDRKDRKEVLRELKIEKIMICGETDPLLDINYMQTIANQCDTNFIRIAGGHMSWMEEPEEIVKVMHLID